MTYDSTSPPIRVIDIVSRPSEPAPDAPAARPRRIDVHLLLLGCPPYVHPRAVLGWPAHAVAPDGSRRAPRRRVSLRRRKGER